MKRILCLFTLTLALAPTLFSQQAAPETPGRLQLAPAPVRAPAPAAPTAAAPAVEPEVTLIPEQVPQRTKPNSKPVDAPKTTEAKSKTEESAEDLNERIHFREARVKALRDPQVQAEWDSAAKAKTDFEKREALKRYYKLLYARILKIDASVKSVVTLRQASSLHRLEQTRIDPTEPFD